MSVLLAANEIVQRIVSLHKKNKKWDFNSIKSSVCKKYSVMPRLVDIISAIPPEYSDLVHLLRAKPVRTSSGVAIVAVMCKPHRCPHIALTGNICIYCPGGVDSDFEYSTQSYTGYEPTSMRAIRHRYDPFQQARTRLLQLQQLGHMPDKVEYIVMGGTFMSLPDSYKNNFIKDLHDALSGNSSSSLEEAIEFSEKSKLKCVGITIETRPDYCKKPHINRMLNYGCTRVEIGVQSIFEDVARDTNRGHSVKDVCNTFCAVKDSGYKIVSHMMPNLPNVDIVRDYMQFEEYFNSPSFRSDGLKIYPTLVMRGTGLYELWKNKKYKNYSPDVLVDFLARILALVPPWTRIYRVQRDIPMPLVSSGVEYGNIRELALAKMKDYGTKCRDIRTREVGMKKIHENVFPEKVELIRRDYAANNGWETFLSYEDIENDILVGMLRLRKCSADTFREELKDMEEVSEDSSYEEEEVDCCLKFDFGFKYNCMNEKCTCMNKDKNENTKKGKEVNKQNNEKEPFIKFSKCKQISYNASIIRELHVYGAAVPILHKDKVRYQHIGYGARLIEEAEQIAREEHGSKKIAIISGVGTRLYYKKFGYRLEGPYMVKDL